MILCGNFHNFMNTCISDLIPLAEWMEAMEREGIGGKEKEGGKREKGVLCGCCSMLEKRTV